MQTNFFSLLQQQTIANKWRMTFYFEDDDNMVVSVLPVNDGVNDKAKELIPPLPIRGTVKHFDEHFFEFVKQSTIKKADGLLANMQSHQKTMDEAEKQSQMEKQKKDKEEKEKAERKKVYDKKIAKVEEHEKESKWAEALKAMPEAKDFPEQANEINKRREELQSKNTVQELF